MERKPLRSPLSGFFWYMQYAIVETLTKGSEGWWRVGATLHSDISLTLSNLHRKSEGWRVFGNILRRSSAPYSKKQCKITKFPPHIQTFPHVFSFKSRDKQRMILYLSNRGTNIQGHRVRYLGSLFRVDVPVLLISLIIIPKIWVQAVSGIYCDYALACWICVRQ